MTLLTYSNMHIPECIAQSNVKQLYFISFCGVLQLYNMHTCTCTIVHCRRLLCICIQEYGNAHVILLKFRYPREPLHFYMNITQINIARLEGGTRYKNTGESIHLFRIYTCLHAYCLP